MNRDLPYEAHLTALAGEAAGAPGVARAVGKYADARSWPGGILLRSIDEWIVEIEQELADARNYICMVLTVIRADFDAGVSWACDRYVQLMGCLVGVLTAWDALHRHPS